MTHVMTENNVLDIVMQSDLARAFPRLAEIIVGNVDGQDDDNVELDNDNGS